MDYPGYRVSGYYILYDYSRECEKGNYMETGIM